MRIAAVGLVGNPEKPELRDAVARIRELCAAARVAVLTSRSLAAVVGPPGSGVATTEMGGRVDLVIALGGDGTMLRAAAAVASSRIPLLGINLGNLGYLTDVPIEDLELAVGQLLAGDFHLEERARVACTAWRGEQSAGDLEALNDIAINMGPLPRALDLEIRLEGESLGRFLGDGLLVCTPTGSTAYNLSAGGPICHAGVDGFLVTPICPHTMGMRPLIVPTGLEIEVRLLQEGLEAQLTADGQQTVRLHGGDRITYRKAPTGVRFVKFPQSSFYRVLRHKLRWGATSRRAEP